jgi:hypothetical protein
LAEHQQEFIAVLDAHVEEGGAAFLEPQVQVEPVIAIDELEQTINEDIYC